MAATWPGSRIPYIDENGDPMVGAQLYFFDEGTTTPQTVYSDGGLGISIAQPVLADARGAFPMIYLQAGTYRQRLLDADGVTVFDDDEISVPQASDYVPPDAGDTDATLLARTGDLKFRYGTGSHSGWVRANARTIGSASSGATERANADCQALFLHLWTEDANLAVSTGRGGSAASDWAANKTIALPDFRSRAPIPLADMGNSNSGLIIDGYVDGGQTAATLGATAGGAGMALAEQHLPAHAHTGSGTTSGESNTHSHGTTLNASRGANGNANRAWSSGDQTDATNVKLDTGANQLGHTHTYSFTTSSVGSGAQHPNMQPSKFCTFYIKL